MNFAASVIAVLAQAGQELPPLDFGGLITRALAYLGPYTEYIVILFVFWLFARRGALKQGDFNLQAQEVLDELYKKGEISEKAYQKFRQDVSIRSKRP